MSIRGLQTSEGNKIRKVGHQEQITKIKRAFYLDYLFVFTFLFTPPCTMCVLTCRRLTQHVKDELDIDLQLTYLPGDLTEGEDCQCAR